MKIYFDNFLSYSVIGASFLAVTGVQGRLGGAAKAGRELTTSSSETFGDIVLSYTDEFTLLYWDKGSGANMDGAFYRPNCPSGFSPLGDMGIMGYSSPNGNNAGVCVKAADGASSPPLANPTGFTWIYGDEGTGAHMDGSTWRPVPPSGFKCLGDVFQTGYDEPETSVVTCVREDLTYYGEIGELIWNDHGSGGDHDLSVFQIDNYEQMYDSATILISVNTFYAEGNYDSMTGTAMANKNLILPLTVHTTESNDKPALTSTNENNDFKTTVASWTAKVPFQIVDDKSLSIGQQVSSSPFYTLTREDTYTSQAFVDNSTGNTKVTTSQTFKTGVSSTDSVTSSETIGISYGYSVGVSAMGVKEKASINLSFTMGFSQTTSVTEMQETDLTVPLSADAYCSAEAWSKKSSLQVTRYDGTIVNTTPFDQNNDSYVYSTYCVDQETGEGVTSTWSS